MKAKKNERAALIVFGGFAGTGKTTLSRRVSSEFGIPRLGSDTIGRTIKNSPGIKGGIVDAYRIAYEVLFRLCEEFLRSGVSTIVDTSMGWAFQWQCVDSIRERLPDILFLPIVLRCPRGVCLERIRQRYEAAPTYYDPPGVYTTQPKLLNIWEFLDRLDRSDVRSFDASRLQDEVYEDVKRYITMRLDATN